MIALSTGGTALSSHFRGNRGGGSTPCAWAFLCSGPRRARACAGCGLSFQLALGGYATPLCHHARCSDRPERTQPTAKPATVTLHGPTSGHPATGSVSSPCAPVDRFCKGCSVHAHSYFLAPAMGSYASRTRSGLLLIRRYRMCDWISLVIRRRHRGTIL